MRDWTADQAVALCRLVEPLCPAFGCHVALTGGCLYKDGSRKDCDLLFYRIRQVESVDVDGLFGALASIGMRRVTEDARWCIKAIFDDGVVDCFFPDLSGDYDKSTGDAK